MTSSNSNSEKDPVQRLIDSGSVLRRHPEKFNLVPKSSSSDGESPDTTPGSKAREYIRRHSPILQHPERFPNISVTPKRTDPETGRLDYVQQMRTQILKNLEGRKDITITHKK